MKKGHIIFISAVLLSILLGTGCDKLSGLFNPFVGTWKAGLFTLTFNPDKTFEMKTGIGVTLESEGKYRYDDEYLYLYFGDDYTNEFTFVFNNDKSGLSLSPKTSSRWFKTTISFDKVDLE